MIDKFDIPYPILLAQYGSTDKETFLEKIPMLENIISYPTTIIIDKTGKVNSIHTGFNGLNTVLYFPSKEKLASLSEVNFGLSLIIA